MQGKYYEIYLRKNRKQTNKQKHNKRKKKNKFTKTNKQTNKKIMYSSQKLPPTLKYNDKPQSN